MKQENGPVIWTMVLCSLVVMVGLGWATSSINSNVEDAFDGIVIPEAPTVDTQAIVDGVSSQIVIPKLPTLKNDNMDDILEGIYPDEVEDLEDDCQDALWDEFGADVTDEIQDILEAELGEEVKHISIVNWNYDDDYNFDVLNLGLSDEENRAGEISTVLRVRYHEVFGDSDWHFAKVESSGTCSDWDKDDNEFDNLTVNYVVA